MKIPQDEFRHLGVQAAYLFGSRAQGVTGPLSDYDYAVLVEETGHTRGDDLHEKLYDLFASMSPRTLENDVIDIVFLKDVGLELRFHVIRYGKVLFDGDQKARLDFETITTLLYCDYRPILDQFDRTIV
ncbi:MAG: nucleotidyltransferase domain-containing protein, partial [Deltaproteobacteria bacterium]|nr:nucleotidyltransferase domain-containing protein [Deltaproteobacteria bacterium]